MLTKVMKCEECRTEIPSKTKIITEGIETWALCPRCQRVNFVFEEQRYKRGRSKWRNCLSVFLIINRVPQCHECEAFISKKYSVNLRNDAYCSKHTKKPHVHCFYCTRYIYLKKVKNGSLRKK